MNKLISIGLLLTVGSAFADVAVIGGRIFTMESPEPIEGATLLIANGRVQAVGVDLDVPFEYRQIDARGKVVTPGLIESYSQFGLMEIGGEATTVDSRVVEYPLGPGFDVSFGINASSTLFAVNRMGGVTRAVVAPQPGVDPLAGFGAVVHLGGGDIVTATRVGLFGGIGATTAEFTGGSRSALWQRLVTAFAQAGRFSANRYRPGERDYSRQDMQALKDFLRADVPLVLSINRAHDITVAIRLAESHDLQLVIVGGKEAWKVREQLADSDVSVVVNVFNNLPSNFESLGARLDNAALLNDAGVNVLFTAGNTHNTKNLRHQAGNAVAYGMPWFDALAAMTRNAARTWGMDDVGVLSVGSVADVVVWSGDPLEVTSWAEHVLINGEPVPMRSRQTRLYERYKDLKAADPPYGYN